MLEGVSCVSVCFVQGVYRDLHPWPEGCVSVWMGIGCYTLQSSSRAIVTTNAFFLTTLALLLSANHERETAHSWPMVRLPCLHAPRRQRPWLSIQGSGAKETRRGRHERGKRPLWVERFYGCTQALSISGLRWTDMRRSLIFLLISSHTYHIPIINLCHGYNTHSIHVCFISLESSLMPFMKHPAYIPL